MIQRRGSFTAVVVEFAGIVIFMLTNTNTVSKWMNESDLRSDVHYLGSSENKAWKKFRPVWDLTFIYS